MHGQNTEQKKWPYATVALDPQLKREIDEIRAKYFFNLPIGKALLLAMPRCPACGGLLIQKFASSNLICAKCGREYELKEVTKA